MFSCKHRGNMAKTISKANLNRLSTPIVQSAGVLRLQIQTLIQNAQIFDLLALPLAIVKKTEHNSTVFPQNLVKKYMWH